VSTRRKLKALMRIRTRLQLELFVLSQTFEFNCLSITEDFFKCITLLNNLEKSCFELKPNTGNKITRNEKSVTRNVVVVNEFSFKKIYLYLIQAFESTIGFEIIVYAKEYQNKGIIDLF
jgi:hypothetical protein